MCPHSISPNRMNPCPKISLQRRRRPTGEVRMRGDTGLVLVMTDTAAFRVVFASTCILGVFVFFQAFLLNDHVRLIARNKTFIDYLAVHSNPFLVRPRALLRKH